jgi:hypothetical protein
MPCCVACGKIKSRCQFYVQRRQLADGSLKGYRTKRCKRCHNKYTLTHCDTVRRKRMQREWAQRGRRERWLRRKQSRHAWLEVLKAKPCADCRRVFPPVCMDFDHRNPRTKYMSIAAMINQVRSKTRILAEIRKCDLVCANCHRLRHARRNGWMSHRTDG